MAFPNWKFCLFILLLQLVASTENAVDQLDLSKWTRLDKVDSTDAVEMSKRRVLETKARLRDVEDDMLEREERQLARERRVANLKKYVHSEIDSGLEEGIKSITF